MTIKMPQLSQFLDYRTFLAEHAAAQKRRNPRWSYGAWARRLGVGGTATLTRIVQGERNPGPKLVDKLIEYFNFSPLESDYFRKLVKLGKDSFAEGAELLTLHFSDTQDPMSTSNTSLANNDMAREQRVFDTIAQWYILAIRELTRVTGSCIDPRWIAENLFFGVTPRQAAYAVRVLCESGLMALDSQGAKKTEAPLQSAKEHTAEALCRYHETMLDNAKKSLRLQDSQPRVTTALTLVFTDQQISEAIQLVDEFREKISALASCATGDHLYQVQIQLFPLLRRTT